MDCKRQTVHNMIFDDFLPSMFSISLRLKAKKNTQNNAWKLKFNAKNRIKKFYYVKLKI